MRWRRLGRVFSAGGQFKWMKSHAQVPRAIEIGEKFRVYFASRQEPDNSGNFVSRIGFVDVDKTNPTRLLEISAEPALDVGGKGEFDEFGVMPGDITRIGDEIRMLYTGWSRPSRAPYQTWIGEAFSDASGSKFTRASSKPAMGATASESILCNGPFTIRVGADEHMFYSSALRWLEYAGRRECLYVVMHASRRDKGNWMRDAVSCIPCLHNMECQNAPTVFWRDGRFHMFFCHRHAVDFRNSQRGYRLGYAWSEDLKLWHRNDSAIALEGECAPWETEMQCYPGVIQSGDETFLFYCGNGFGKAGFGVAVLE